MSQVTVFGTQSVQRLRFASVHAKRISTGCPALLKIEKGELKWACPLCFNQVCKSGFGGNLYG